MIRMIFIAAIISFSIQQTVSLPVDELEESQKTVDVKVGANRDDYEMAEINKLSMPDESEYKTLKRLQRQPETLTGQEKATTEKTAQPSKSESANLAAGASIPELQETIDEKVKADADDYKMEEINKLAIPDEYEYTRLKRLERQAETEAKEKPAPAPPQPQPAHIEQGAPAASAANLQLTISFQKHIAVLGIALSVLYTMKEYLCV